MASAATAAPTPIQLAATQRAARVAAQAGQNFAGLSPPPGYHPAGAGPSRQPPNRGGELLVGTPMPPSILKELWTPSAFQPRTHSVSRMALIEELGDESTQPGHNRLQELATEFSPTARALESQSLPDQLLDGFLRGSGCAINTPAAQEIHDRFLFPRPGGNFNPALQAVLHPPAGTEVRESTVLLCHLQALEVCGAFNESQESVI